MTTAQDTARDVVTTLLEPSRDYLRRWCEFANVSLVDEDFEILWTHFERLTRSLQGLVDFMGAGQQIGADMSRMTDLGHSLAEMSRTSHDAIL